MAQAPVVVGCAYKFVYTFYHIHRLHSVADSVLVQELVRERQAVRRAWIPPSPRHNPSRIHGDMRSMET